MKWYMVCQGTGSTKTWSVFKYSNALNPIVSGSVLLCLFLLSAMGGSANAAVMIPCLVVLLALSFIFMALLLSLFPSFYSPPAFCRYLLPLLPVVSSATVLLAVYLHQLVGCFSCSRSDFLASHSSEPLVFSFFLFPFFSCCDGLARFVVFSCRIRLHFTCLMLINHCDRLVYPLSQPVVT